ncbi:MAG: CDP-glycerol glycerophosphotransferase family protein [Eubacterium sp.]|nr:CDP-glycerol glycerophosphotransferase family protein [Eubacterium sp.]
MIGLFGKLFGFAMGILYSFFKLKKTENKVAFISRQSEEPSLDFLFLINEIKANYPQYKVEVLCKMIPAGIIGKIKYIGEFFRQMNALATSKVAVLDGYCILACMLTHKKELKIIQIWHALGAYKRFGKSILDMEGGSSSAMAKAFKMHSNYDLIAASGFDCVKYFSEAFGQPKEKFIPIGIPRMDHLTDEAENDKMKNAVYEAYPKLNNGKKTILYVPTFRDREEDVRELHTATRELIGSIDFNVFNLIIKHHVLDSGNEEIYVDSKENPIVGASFEGMDLMPVSDYVITDYSSIIYEALLKELPIYLFCFDGEKYIDERGFYIDFWNDIPAVYSKTAQGIYDAVAENMTVSHEKTEAFKKAYVNKKYPSITKIYGEIIDELIRGVYDNRYNFRENKDE